MNLNHLFTDIAETPKAVSSKPENPENANKIPIRDSSTLNQLLYKNETYNKRPLPVNPDKKPFHAILKSSHVCMSELHEMIDKDIEGLLNKSWYQIPMNLKNTLIKDYAVKHSIEISTEQKAVILKDRTLVKYNKKEHCIDTIKIK
jgi:hypothetical protein